LRGGFGFRRIVRKDDAAAEAALAGKDLRFEGNRKPSASAVLRASAAVVTTRPSGVVIPAARKSDLPRCSSSFGTVPR